MVLASTATKEEIFASLKESAFKLVDQTEFEDTGRSHKDCDDTFHIFAMHIDGNYWKTLVEQSITASGHKFKWL